MPPAPESEPTKRRPSELQPCSTLGLQSGIDLLKIDLTDTRSFPKKRRPAKLDLSYLNSLLSLA